MNMELNSHKETDDEIRRFCVAHTPMEIALFTVRSAVYLFKKQGINQINALDPFTGDGVFIQALLDCGIKNITAYEIREQMALQTAKRFNGLAKVVCTDTFNCCDDSFNLYIGNPPYGKVAENSAIDNRIKQTYYSKRVNKVAIYDAYVRAIRWASDCLKYGIIAYVINNGFLENCSFDGFRIALEKEFNEIYVVNLRGNHRTSGELCKKEGENIFGQECRTGIAILMLCRWR